ncbi:MAG TPA: hypothetical protein VLH08_21245 [Acidobacteriota bacterium]|jgi:hypothetical protein|nr:hypothetical protein [Acidobacteriota bacterium]
MKTLFQLMVIAIFVITGSLVYSQQTQTQPQTDQSSDSPLMKAAKKERERREKTKTAGKPVKSFTNQDIEEFKAKNKDSEASSTEGEPEEATESETTTENTATTDQSQNEEAWRKRSRDIAQRVKNAEEKLEKLQTDINALTQAFYAESDGVSQRGQIEAERNARLSELEATKKELESAKQAQEDLREEARRAGALPGWIEE